MDVRENMSVPNRTKPFYLMKMDIAIGPLNRLYFLIKLLCFAEGWSRIKNGESWAAVSGSEAVRGHSSATMKIANSGHGWQSMKAATHSAATWGTIASPKRRSFPTLPDTPLASKRIPDLTGRVALQNAVPDKAGHREKAIGLVNEAIEQTQQGIQAAAK
jgi:hypothetical protein